ncbi:hypothetical protein T492DRAFT_934226 [Pavlovales sp. CCMP2436]|nr:hypothetical protein T492DRAFT_934226 [Pavlovales sp. CCMP2436]
MGFLNDGAASPVSFAVSVLSAEEQLAHRRERNRISTRLCHLRKKETIGQLEARLASPRKLDEQLRAINAENQILQDGIRTSNSSEEDEAGHRVKRLKTLEAIGVFEVPPSRCFGMKLAVGDSFDAPCLITVRL